MTNDIADWFPKLEATGVAVPRTEIVKTECDLLALLDGQTPKGFRTFESELIAACLRIGFPLFLRSGHTSGKHDWNKTCYVAGAVELHGHLARIIEYGELSSIMGLPWNTWAVRELLPVNPLFTAFHSEMPVTKERRYFIENGDVICHHPYWPADSIQCASADNWQELLEASSQESEEEVEMLSRQSRIVSNSFKGAWSLDWLFTERGWFAIDMAHAADSWHWPGCEEK